MSHQTADTVTINVDLDDVYDYPDNQGVGRIYEVALNGTGFMLADHPEQEVRYQRGAVDLMPQRLATSDTPLDQAIDRYNFAHDDDWAAGAGQQWRDRPDSVSNRYWDSDGVDPFTERGVLSLLNATEESLASTYADLRAVVVGDELYALTAANQLTRHNGTAWQTPFTVTSPAAVSITDLASDGQYWYAATGSLIVRGTTADPAATWSAEAASSIRWAGGRICAAVIESGSTPNRFTTLAPDGTEELTNGHLTLEAGHTIVLGGAAQGVFWFGSYVGDRGMIWAWQLGLDSEGNFHTPFVAWELPQGLIPTAVGAAGGEVWIRAYQAEGPSAGNVFIYRGVPSQGLVPILVADLGPADRDGAFTEHNDLVLFSWESAAGTEGGLGAISLASGGYARWLKADGAGQVLSMDTWQGLEMFTVTGQGVFLKDADAYETSGWLTTSLADGPSSLDKIWDVVEVVTVNQLDANESITVEGTVTEGASYFSVGTLTGAGAQKAQFEVQKKAVSMGLKYTLASGGTTQTTLTLGTRRYYPLGLADVMLVLPIDCSDNLVGINGHELPENKNGAGATRARSLEALTQRRVRVQDIDWPVTQEAHVYVVVNSQVSATGVYDKHKGRKVWRTIVTLTLRRPLIG